MKKNPLLKLAAAALFSGVSGVFADITYDITSDYVLDADYSISQIQTVSNGATYTIAKSLTNSASGYVLTLSNRKTEILWIFFGIHTANAILMIDKVRNRALKAA